MQSAFIATCPNSNEAVIVVLGVTTVSEFRAAAAAKGLIRTCDDEEGYEFYKPLQAFAVVTPEGVWDLGASADTPGALPAMVATARWVDFTSCQCEGCPVHEGTHKPAGVLHQIDEPQPEALRLADALTIPGCTLEHGDCMKAGELLRAQHTRIAGLGAKVETDKRLLQADIIAIPLGRLPYAGAGDNEVLAYKFGHSDARFAAAALVAAYSGAAPQVSQPREINAQELRAVRDAFFAKHSRKPLIDDVDFAQMIVARFAAQALQVERDAARWRETIRHVSAEYTLGGYAQYVMRGLQMPANVMRGSVAEHFTKSIDAEVHLGVVVDQLNASIQQAAQGVDTQPSIGTLWIEENGANDLELCPIAAPKLPPGEYALFAKAKQEGA